MQALKDYKFILSVAFLILVIGAVSLVLTKPWQTFGSVEVGHEYIATSTRTIVGTNNLANFQRLDCPSALARVTVTGDNAGTIRLWDATTTNINLRDSSQSSSTLRRFEIAGSAPENTYDFDAVLRYGLVYELIGTEAPTSTIACR